MEEIIKSELAFTNGLVIIVLFFIVLIALHLDKLRRDKIAIKNSLERIENEYRNIYDVLANADYSREAVLFGRQLLNHNIEVHASKDGRCWKYKEKLYNTKDLFDLFYNPHH